MKSKNQIQDKLAVYVMLNRVLNFSGGTALLDQCFAAFQQTTEQCSEVSDKTTVDKMTDFTHKTQLWTD